MPTTTAATPAHTPLADSAQRDPLRERDLTQLGLVGCEVRHTGLSQVTVTLSVAQFDQLSQWARDSSVDPDHDCSEFCDETHHEDIDIDTAIEIVESYLSSARVERRRQLAEAAKAVGT